MSERSHTARQLVGLAGMPPKSERSVYLFAEQRGMVKVPGARPARWLHSSLPAETRAALDLQSRGALDRAGPIAPGPAPSAPSSKGRAASERDQAVADARLDILTALDRFIGRERPPVVNEALHRFVALYNAGDIAVAEETRAAVATISWRSIQRWRRARRDDGWSGLLPRRARPEKGGAIERDPEIRDAIVAHILERPGHVNRAYIMQALRLAFPGIENKGRLPSMRSLQRFVARWLADNARLLSAVADPDRHRSRYQPAAGDAGANITRLNQLWELDSTPADVICTDGRHAVVGAIDVATRRGKVLVVPSSKAAAIAALLRRAILAWGVPETVRTDEGADYVSRHVRRALADLSIRHDVLPPFSPEKKPFVERFLGTLSRGLFQRLPGFAGHNVAEAQAIRSQKSFARRRGEGDAEAFQVALSAAELQAACDAWIETVYERSPHKGLNGRSPFEAAAGQPVRSIDDERALDVLLAAPADGGGYRTVQKKGIHAEGTIFIAAELGPLVGERVEVRLDPADAGGLYVFDTRGAFVCRAVAPEREGVDRQALALAMRRAARKADAEARAYARDLKRRVKPEAAIDAILAAAGKSAAEVVAFPARTSPHRTARIEAASEAADAHPASDASARRRDAEEEEAERLIAEGEAVEMVSLAEARRRAEEAEAERLIAEAEAYAEQLRKRDAS